MDPYKSTWPKYLQYGDVGNPVVWLQERLLEQGYFAGAPKGNFLGLTRNALMYFQSTHLDKRGVPLDSDGVFGPETLWAIRNPSGEKQRSNIPGMIPEGLTGSRLAFLSTVLDDYNSGEFIEIPDGSNSGPRISKFSRGTYWCCFYQSDAWYRTFKKYPLGEDQGHCLTFWREAMAAGKALKKENHDPLPGDMGVILYRNNSGNLTGSGHIFTISGVSSTGRQFNTFGGNEGNRLKHGLREKADSSIVGWIDLHGDSRDSVKFKRGIITAQTQNGLSSTR